MKRFKCSRADQRLILVPGHEQVAKKRTGMKRPPFVWLFSSSAGGYLLVIELLARRLLYSLRNPAEECRTMNEPN